MLPYLQIYKSDDPEYVKRDALLASVANAKTFGRATRSSGGPVTGAEIVDRNVTDADSAFLRQLETRRTQPASQRPPHSMRDALRNTEGTANFATDWVPMPPDMAAAGLWPAHAHTDTNEADGNEADGEEEASEDEVSVDPWEALANENIAAVAALGPPVVPAICAPPSPAPAVYSVSESD